MFAACIPVKGIRRSGICDIQRGTFETIPNSLWDVLQNCKSLSMAGIYATYGEDNQEVLDEFFTWLIENEFGFWCNSLEEFKSFPDMALDWDSPYEIQNMIIDLNEQSTYSIENLTSQIKELRVPYIQIRSYSPRHLDYFAKWFEFFDDSPVKTIDIVTPYYEGCNNENFARFSKRFIRLNSIIFFNSPIEDRKSELNKLTSIIFVKKNISGNHFCGIISPDFFTVNKPLLTESIHHNNCLNRKISVDCNGEIKNCPSISRSFGNISNTSLRNAMKAQHFRDLWSIKKSEIEVCNSCEYRYICTDCRAYLEKPDNLYSKPLKCGYDPSSAIWSEWSTNPLKAKVIAHYGFAQELRLG